MTDYIEKNSVIELIDDAIRNCKWHVAECTINTDDRDLKTLREKVKATPAADVAPVVHGRWVWRSPSELRELPDPTKVIYCVKSRFLDTTGVGTGWWVGDGYIEDAHGGRYAIDHPRLYGWMPAPEPLTERME